MSFRRLVRGRPLLAVLSALAVVALITAGALNFLGRTPNAQAQIRLSHYILRQIGSGNEASGETLAGPAQEQYANRALPRTSVDAAQVIASSNAFTAVEGHAYKGKNEGNSSPWQLVGPVVGNVDALATYTGRPTVTSGRTVAIVVDPNCTASECRVWIGAAGGGVWRTENGLAAAPKWQSVSKGLPVNAIGSLALDPNDHTGNTIYVGTGEPSGSSDSEAGLGLYKSTNGGNTWHLVPGSFAVAHDRAIAGVAIDPANRNHIFIGTAVARHGASSVNGGRFTPPNAPLIGLYESTNGGATFTLAYSRPSDSVNPANPTGGDFFRGGVSNVEFDRTGVAAGQPSRVYFSVYDWGLYRGDGNGNYEQLFASAGLGRPQITYSVGSRTEFALAPMGNNLRIYVGDTSGAAPADLFRVDNANVPGSTLTDGTYNPGWTKLSNSSPTTTGYDSYNFCGGQCSYDMVVASPKGQPNTVYLGGQMFYNEIFTSRPPSNGRAVLRSSNAGVSFTDMTNDNRNPPLGMHPDQHGMAFSPTNPDIVFAVSDGGIVRTSGQFANASGQCASRGLTPTQLANCQRWLSAIPTQIDSLNAGLSTLQFQSVTVNPQNPKNDLMGGTQDNGTWAYNGTTKTWFETIGGDGGQSAINYFKPNIRVHSYYGPYHDVNFRTNDPAGWNWISDPLALSGEQSSFYVPIIADPKVDGTMFVGLQHVWRTLDNGGPQAYLETVCNEYTGTFTGICGDWVPMGQDLTTGPLSDKGGSYVVALTRAPSDNGTLWAATRLGRLFISTNANDVNPAAVSFTRLDTSAQPNRFISGIAVDPANKYHAFVSFSGYSAYAAGGHVYDVTVNPVTMVATWKDISHDLGDVPVTSIAYDNVSQDLYIASDFGVAVLQHESDTWVNAAQNLPRVAVYGLTIAPQARVLYAATHGRGIWRTDLQKQGDGGNNG